MPSRKTDGTYVGLETTFYHCDFPSSAYCPTTLNTWSHVTSHSHVIYTYNMYLMGIFLVISLPTTNGIAVTSIITTTQKMLLLVLKQFMMSQILHYMHNGWNIWLFVCCCDTYVHICIWIYTYVCVRIKIKMFLMYLVVYLHPCEKVIRFLFRIKFDRHSKMSL